MAEKNRNKKSYYSSTSYRDWWQVYLCVWGEYWSRGVSYLYLFSMANPFNVKVCVCKP